MLIKKLLTYLCCPDCAAGQLQLVSFDKKDTPHVTNGVIYCRKCRRWYPVIDKLLEFLPKDKEYPEDKKNFFCKYERQLTKLGLTYKQEPLRKNHQRIQQAHFDWYANNNAQTYTTYANSTFWKSVDRFIFARWRPLLSEGNLILDIGCGQGRSTFQLSDLPVQIIAFDISREMIRQAIKKYSSCKHRASITFLVADATTLPFKSSGFNAVLTYGVLHHLANPVLGCREIARILKPNGIFLALENNKSFFRIVFDLMQKINPLWTEKAGSSPLISRSDLDKWFKNTKVKVRSSTLTFITPHFIVGLPFRIADILLRSSDTICSRVPWLRKQGGLIAVVGKK